LVEPGVDTGEPTGDLSGDESFASAGTLMVEKDAVAGIHPIGFTVVNRDPIGIELGYAVGASWVEWSCFSLWNFLDKSVEF
jgi:hypothetical protein